MNEFNKRIRERWEQKRKKASNWTGLLIKILIIIAIIYAMQRLSKSNNIEWSNVKTQSDSVQTDTLR